MFVNGKITNSGEVYTINLSTGAMKFIGCTTETSMSKTIDSNDLRCGITGGLAGIAYTNPDMTVTVATIAHNDFLMQMQNDEEFVTAVTLDVPRNSGLVTLTTVSSDGTYTFTPAITPVGGNLYFQDKYGKDYPVVYASPTATVTGGAGLTGTFVWKEEIVNGETFDFNVDSRPKAMGLVIKHLVEAIDTNEPIAHVYYEFDNVVGDGNFDMSMTLNNTAGTTVTLRALPNTGRFSRQIYEPIA